MFISISTKKHFNRMITFAGVATRELTDEFAAITRPAIAYSIKAQQRPSSTKGNGNRNHSLA